MSWYLGGPNLSSITELLDNPDTTVEMVLNDSSITQALRQGLDSLLSFFFDIEDHLTHLLNMVLTDYVPTSSAIPAKTTRMALQVLTTTSSSKNIEKLVNNALFLQRLNDFPNSEFATNTRACGHYGRIIEAFTRATHGEFLKSVPTLQDFLKKKMINLGLRELFSTLITDFPSAMGISQEYFIEITADPPENTMFYIISGIALAIPNQKDFINYINNVQFVKNLIDLAKREQDSLCRVSLQAYLLIDKIMASKKQDQDLKNLLAEESTKFDFSKEMSPALLGAVLRVFTTKEDKILLKVLEKGNSTFINDGIVRSFLLFNDEELMQFNERNNFSAKIMELFPQTKANSHLSKLIKIFNRINASNEEWNKFVAEVANPREEQRCSNYGGQRPPVDSDTSFDESMDDDSDKDSDDDDCENLFNDESDSSSSAELSSGDEEDDDELSSGSSSDDDELSSSSDSDQDSDDDTHERPTRLHKYLSKPIPSHKHKSSSDEEEDMPVQMAKAPPLDLNYLLHSDDDDNVHHGDIKYDPNMNFNSSSSSSSDNEIQEVISDSDQNEEKEPENQAQQQPEEHNDEQPNNEEAHQQEQNSENVQQENTNNQQEQGEIPQPEEQQPTETEPPAEQAGEIHPEAEQPNQPESEQQQDKEAAPSPETESSQPEQAPDQESPQPESNENAQAGQQENQPQQEEATEGEPVTNN